MWREVRRRVEHQLGFDAPAPPAPPGPPLPQPQIPSPSELPQRSAVRILGPDDEPSPVEPRPRGDRSEEEPEARAGDGSDGDDDRDDVPKPDARKDDAGKQRSSRGSEPHDDEHADTHLADVPHAGHQAARAPRDAGAKARSTRASRGRVLGVNVVDGVAYLMVVDATGTPLPETADRVAPPADGDSGKRLAAFSETIARGLRSQRIDVVAVARPVRYTNWRYADAADRAALETCIALAAHANGVRFESVGQHHAANVIGLPMSRLGDLLASRLKIHKTPSWRERWPALLVALAAGQRDRSASPTSAAR